MPTTFGLPSVSVPVLSITMVSTRSNRSSASASRIRMPECAPRPTPTMIDIGVARPSAQGQAMISTVTAATSAKVKRGSGPNTIQAANASKAAAITAGTNQPATRSARRWIGARERCARATMSTIRASMVSRPTLSARRIRPPLWLTVPPIDVRAFGLRHRHRFAGHHRFVDRRAAFGDDAIDRNLLAGPHPQAIADRDRVDRDILVAVARRCAARFSAPARAARGSRRRCARAPAIPAPAPAAPAP